jgi:ABC-type sugar transport systems, permease components
MNDTLSKIEKRTAYTLLLPAVFLVFAIVLFPIFANIWISFKEVQLKDIRIPEPRAKKIVKSIPEDKTKLKIVYRLRNSSLIEDINNIKFSDSLPRNIEPVELDSRCEF